MMRMKSARWIGLIAGAVGVVLGVAGAESGGLPDPLTFADGKPVVSAQDWPRRRTELKELLTREMYGQMPGRPAAMRFQVVEEDKKALGGKATRRQVRIDLDGTTNGPQLNVLMYVPRFPFRRAAILGLNFWGNHAIHPDPGILLSRNWTESGKNPYVDLSCVTNHVATEGCRGINARQWPVEKILQEGFALVTCYREDVAPDRPNGMTNGVMSMYPELQGRGDNFATIGAWAWSLSRIIDYLETDRDIDPKKLGVIGWSRLGKAALWAAANDERIAAVVSLQSGAGGAKLFHRGVGEDVRRLNTVFPHWYCGNFRKYNDRDKELPFDQHLVLSLIAPRPVYVASAIVDKNADPEGEFEAARAVVPVYRFLGLKGMSDTAWPGVNLPTGGQVRYHVRSGNHDVTDYDWDQLLFYLKVGCNLDSRAK